jgi:hypothetical protein
MSLGRSTMDMERKHSTSTGLLVAVEDGKIGSVTIRRGRTRIHPDHALARSGLFEPMTSDRGADALRSIGCEPPKGKKRRYEFQWLT